MASVNGSREDEYYWLRDDKRENPEMLAYLKAENEYADRMLAHIKPLETRVYNEIIGRLKQDDASVPYLMNGYWYYRRYETGKEYPIYARRKGSKEAPEEIMLDVNEMARGHDFFEVGEIAISPDNALMAWAEDTVGRRQYTIRVMDLGARKVFPIALGNVESNVVWAGDNKTILYIEKDPDTLLGRKVRRHSLDSANHTDVAADPLVWEQTDESFYTGVGKTKDDKYLWIGTQSTVSSEMWYADANDPKLRFKLFLPRERDHEYQAEHVDGRWIVRTNYLAKNFRIVEVRVGAEGDRSKWKDVIAHRPDAFVDSFDVTKKFLTVEEHSGGLRKLRIHPWSGGADVMVTADEPSYTMALDVNREFDSGKLRYTYTSMVTPRTTYDYDFATGQRELLKREPVLGGYDPANYASEFAWATARDGTRVPVSIVYRKTHAARWHRTAAADRLRLVWVFVRSGVLVPAGLAARPRLRGRHCAHSRRPGNGPQLVRGRQAAQQEEYLHGLHRRDPLAGGQQVQRSEKGLRHRAFGGRVAHGRDCQHGARGLRGHRHRRAVRRRDHHHAR